MQVADITRADVLRWFAARRGTPVAADRSLPILSVILKEAERLGYRPEGSNPCRGIRRYRRKGRERYLSDAEIGRLAATLSAHEREWPLQVAAVRLLLTGCRKSEILTLRWSEVDGDTIALADAKAGPRKVYLNARARRIIERQPRGYSAFVFPSHRNPERPHDTHLSLWDRVRKEVGIEDVRLHDLRHTMASHAVMNGVPVPVVSRLLGHANVQMTLRYAHLADKDIETAAERIGAAMAAQ